MRKKILQKLNNLSLIMLLVDLRAQRLGLNPSAWTLMWILLITTIYFMGLLFTQLIYLYILRHKLVINNNPMKYIVVINRIHIRVQALGFKPSL